MDGFLSRNTYLDWAKFYMGIEESLMLQFQNKLLTPRDVIMGESIYLRLLLLSDCTPRYLNWLSDKDINRYLETRWTPQTLETITSFVGILLEDPDNYLFAIIEKKTNQHIGNIKVGPINPYHRYADVSYFIGEKRFWGKGYATEAIKLIKFFSFDTLGLNCLQAGVYENNVASSRALKRAGFVQEAILKKRLLLDSIWEDLHFYVAFNYLNGDK